MFSKINTVFLITNGIRLIDYDYLRKLKRKGLRYISFSLNGFSDDVYKKINGRSLVDLKLRALNNIKKAGIKTIMSVLLVKGINEKQISPILDYCLENRDFIEELRIRSMVPLGKYIHNEKYTIADLLEVVCKEINIKKEDAFKEFRLKEQINPLFRKRIFPLMFCSFDFHLKKHNDKIFPVGQNIEICRIESHSFKKIFLLFEMIKAYGIKMVTAGFLKTIFKDEKRPWIHSENIFKIGLRSWPGKEDIDIEENKRCQTGYYLNGDVVPFCHANILIEGNHNKSD